MRLSAWERTSVDFKGPIVTSKATESFLWLLTSIVGPRLPSLVKILLPLQSSNASTCCSVSWDFRLCSVTGGQRVSVENWRTICTSDESPPAVLLLITVLETLNVNVSTKLFGKQFLLCLKGGTWDLTFGKRFYPKHCTRWEHCFVQQQTLHRTSGFLPFPRRSMLGRSLPTCLITPNTVLLKRFVRNKSEPLCDEVELLDGNPKIVFVRFLDGWESKVSISH